MPLQLEQAGPAGKAIATRLQGTLAAVSLPSQVSLITAIANDVDYDMIFAQQVYGLGRPGDVLLAISTSGTSRNVSNAVLVAKAFGLKSIALTGQSGGDLAPLAECRDQSSRPIMSRKSRSCICQCIIGYRPSWKRRFKNQNRKRKGLNLFFFLVFSEFRFP